MTTTPKPIVHLPLQELRTEAGATKTPNLGAQGKSATITGDPRIVHDPDRGSCMRFLTHDGLELALKTDSYAGIAGASDVTVAIWLRFEELEDYADIVNIGGGRGALSMRWENLLLAADGTLNANPRSGVAFKVSGESRRASAAWETPLLNGEWIHLAATWKASGELRTYVDGVQRAKEDQTVGALEGPWKILNLGNFKDCKVAHLRIYDQALDEKQIATIRALDRRPSAALRPSYPLEFDLYTVYATDHERALFIEAPGVGEPLELSMTNTTARDLTFAPVAAPSESAYQVQLRFRKNVVAPAVLEALRQNKLQIPGWNHAVSDKSQTGREDWISLVSKQPLTLVKDVASSVSIPDFSAAARFGARNTRVEVRYANLGPAAAGGKPLSGSVIRFMSIQSHLGQKDVPLVAGFEGSNTLLNDGESANALTLRVSNLDPAKPVPMTTASEDPQAPTRFILTVPAGLAQPSLEAAPDTPLGSSTAGLDASPGEHGAAGHTFVFTVTEVAAEYAIRLDNWITLAPSGIHQITLAHENISGYRDGAWSIPVQLGPLVVRGAGADAKVGVGTDTPEAKLHVKGDQTKLESDLQVMGKEGSDAPVRIVHEKNDYEKTDGTSGALVIQGESATGYVRHQKTGNLERLCIGSTQGGLLTQSYKDTDHPDGIPEQNVLMWDREGNVGIGLAGDPETVNAPGESYRLAVEGDARISKKLTVHELHADNANLTGYLECGKEISSTGGRFRDKTGDVMPVGAIIAFGAKSPPRGWKLCDGSSIASGDEYAELRAVVGNNVPDLRSRFVVGAGKGGGKDASNEDLSTYQLNARGGEEKHRLVIGEMPRHSHTINDGDFGKHDRSFEGSGDRDHPFETSPSMKLSGTDSAGNDQLHENRPPYYALTYIIKY